MTSSRIGGPHQNAQQAAFGPRTVGCPRLFQTLSLGCRCHCHLALQRSEPWRCCGYRADLSALGLHLDSASPHTFTPGIYKRLATPSLSADCTAKWTSKSLILRHCKGGGSHPITAKQTIRSLREKRSARPRGAGWLSVSDEALQ